MYRRRSGRECSASLDVTYQNPVVAQDTAHGNENRIRCTERSDLFDQIDYCAIPNRCCICLKLVLMRSACTTQWFYRWQLTLLRKETRSGTRRSTMHRPNATWTGIGHWTIDSRCTSRHTSTERRRQAVAVCNVDSSRKSAQLSPRAKPGVL